MPRCIALLVLLIAAVGCAKHTTADLGNSAASLDGAKSPEGTALAYEHRAELSMTDGPAVTAAAENLANACREQRFGDCALLGFEQSGGEWPSATVTMRLAPDGVAHTLKLVTDAGGTLTKRTTKAEDLGGALADLKRERASLEAQRTRLEAAVDGRSVTASDAIALAAELGRIDARLAEIDAGERAQRRRIDTNLLTVDLQVPYDNRQRDAWSAFDGLGGEIVESGATGVSEGLTILAYLGPMILLLLLPTLGLALLWRRLWRWATRPRG